LNQERDFKGTDRAALRDGPVQFEREEDPFGLKSFFEDIRYNGSGNSASLRKSTCKRREENNPEQGHSIKRQKK
jgi:hypothetical protein